ncbi:hypothetical protein SAMN02745866_01637 [Alteromonadaceae bacterium Bs31]|nr:hypothetical protein SAMN02745866_01637 [Alteromonadaceae bacterium Bs31]
MARNCSTLLNIACLASSCLFRGSAIKSLLLCLPLCCSLLACGGSNGGEDEPTPSPNPSSKPTPTEEPSSLSTRAPQRLLGDSTLSGFITFDSVPHSTNGALDFSRTEQKPSRGVTILVLGEDAEVLRSARTDESGYYEVGAPESAEVRVVALAELKQSGTPGWNFLVVDNTDRGAEYSVVGELQNVDAVPQRNLHAASGWDELNDNYVMESLRPAAPFAILDATYDVVSALAEIDTGFSLPAVKINWSYKNIASAGNAQDGFIGSSKYDLSLKEIFILGDAANDSDEYDFSVIQHELAHFIEDSLSRTDNIGGAHSLSVKHDLRVAYGEGLANAFTGIVSKQPYYLDAAGIDAFYHLSINLESNRIWNAGWYSENSVGKIIYDIADAENEDGDELSLGLAGIYHVLVDESYVKSDALTSIYLFADVFTRIHGSSNASALSAMLEQEQIYGTGRFGEYEINDGGVDNALPVYRDMVQGELVEVCSGRQVVEYNGLGVSKLIHLTITSPGLVTFLIRRTVGDLNTNPDAKLYSNGNLSATMDSLVINSERASYTLASGAYVLEVFDNNNVDELDSTGGEACFSVSVM